jgi:hypothetical protein
MTATDSKSRKKQPSETVKEKTAEVPKRVPVALLFGSWFLPGLGHWILGKRKRAVIFAVVIFCSFVTGVLLQGEIGTPKPDSPFSWLAAFACLGNGVFSIARLIWLNGLGGLLSGIPFGLQGGGSPSAAGFAYGNTFLYTAGLMNLLAVLDVSDIARGEKD